MRLLWALFSFASLFHAACTEPISSAADPDHVLTTLSGFAYFDEPFAGADVEVFEFAAGQTRGLYGYTKTGSDGSFLVELGSKYGDLLVVVSRGQRVVRRLVPGVTSGEDRAELAVTPVTTLAAAHAAFGLQTGSTDDPALALDVATSLVYGHFGELDHDRIRPASPAGGALEPGPELLAGILTAGLAKMAQGIKPGAGLEGLVPLLEDDLQKDGLFDGAGAAGRLRLGTVDLSADTMRGEYARFIVACLDSDANASEVTADQLRDLIDRIADSESRLFDTEPAPPDYAGPEVTIDQPQAGQALSGLVAVVVTATDPHGPVRIEAADVPELAGSQTADRFEGVIDTSQVEDGPLVLSFVARDRFGNEGEATVEVQVSNRTPLSGLVFKGPLRFSEVRAHAVSDQGESLLGAAETDQQGRFSLDLGVWKGPVRIEARFGRYEEEALGTDVSLASGETLSALVPASYLAEHRQVTVSALTSLAAAHAEYLMAELGLSADAAAAEAHALYQAHFGLDLFATEPVDLSAESDAPCDNLTDRVRYALYCAGLSQMALQMSEQAGLTPGAVVNGISLTGALAADASDGRLDGISGHEQLVLGQTALSSYTLRADLARAINNYLDGPHNRCGLSPDDFRASADHLAASASALFPGDEPPQPVDNGAPLIVFETHEDEAPVAGPITVSVRATDDSALESLYIVSPVGLATQGVLEEISASEARVTFSVDTRDWSDGLLPVLYRATDSAGNITDRVLNLRVDNTPPDLSWLAPKNSHLNREAGLTFSGVVFEQGAGMAGVWVEGIPASLSQGAWSLDLDLAAGEHLVTVSARDRAGNEATETRAFVVDVHTPACALVPTVWTSDRRFYPCMGGQLTCAQALSAHQVLVQDSTFTQMTPTFEKISEKLAYGSAADLQTYNLPVLALACEDDWTGQEDLAVTWQAGLEGQGLSPKAIVPFVPGQAASHPLPISSALGAAILHHAPGDLHRLVIEARDRAGHTWSREYRFRIKLIAAPLAIAIDHDYPSNAADPHNLHQVRVERCTDQHPDPDVAWFCHNDGYEGLFASSGVHPEGARLARVTIANPGPEAVFLTLPPALTESGIRLWRNEADRLVFLGIGEYESTPPGDCYAGQALRCPTYESACTTCSACFSVPQTISHGNQGPSVELVREGASSGPIAAEDGRYLLEAGVSASLFVALPPLPDTLHVHPLREEAFGENRVRYRGGLPYWNLSHPISAGRTKRLSATWFQREVYIPVFGWEQGLFVEYQMNFSPLVSRADVENAESVTATIDPIKGLIQVDLINPRQILGELGTPPIEAN